MRHLVEKMISMYFGSPGSGKTTTAIRLLARYRYLNEYSHYYANFETSLATYINVSDLGKFTPPSDSLLVIDESGIEFNNREYKSLSKCTIEWLKLHRHYGVDVVVISQSWEDTDVVIRRLVTDLYHIRKVLCFTRIRKIYKNVGIDKNTHQIIDEYRFGSIFGNLIGRDNFALYLRNGYYRFFDSYSRPNTPVIADDFSYKGKRLPFDIRIRSFPSKVRRWFGSSWLGRLVAVLCYFVVMLLVLVSCSA